MKVWLIRDLEPLPTDPGNRRLMRAGMLALALGERGHATTWFTSSFDHYLKRQRSSGDRTVPVNPNLTVQILRSPGYSRNISLRRLLHNSSFAARWRRYAQDSAEKPDALVTDVPTTEAAEAVVEFGRSHGIPTVVSIRDIWPDSFFHHVPILLRPLAWPFLRQLDRQAIFATKNATSLVGISSGYLDWGTRKGERWSVANDRVFPLGYQPRPSPDVAATRGLFGRLAIPEGASIVCFVGSWGKTHDLRLLLDTARAMTERRDVFFVLAGNADARPDLRDSFLTLSNVVLPGWLSGDEIATLVSASAIGVLPYGRAAPQGLPNKAFEYMAYGAYQLASLSGELGAFYAATGAGRVAEPDSFVSALIDCLPLALDPVARADRIAMFDGTFTARVVYGAMVRHIEEVVANFAPGVGKGALELNR